MSLEPVSENKVLIIAKHFGLFPIRIKGTSQVNICKTLNDKKYDVISWEEFFTALDLKKLQVYKDSSSCFLKIMKRKENE